MGNFFQTSPTNNFIHLLTFETVKFLFFLLFDQRTIFIHSFLTLIQTQFIIISYELFQFHRYLTVDFNSCRFTFVSHVFTLEKMNLQRAKNKERKKMNLAG